jgi:anti-sigma regulatory factor (Ser/Thr protein kinase)
MTNQLHFTIVEASQVAEARRAITALARSLGFNETELGKVAIVVTEAATNLVKHTAGGQLLVRSLNRAGMLGLELLVLDQGPGLANVSRALADGYSTAGSPGTGLGALARLSAVFDIHSLPAKGTGLLVQLFKQNGQPGPGPGTPVAGNRASLPLEIGAVCLPKPGLEVCGDNWEVIQGRSTCLIMVADGLGHGPEAATASRTAVETLSENQTLRNPRAVIETAHAALHHTRGAALAVAELDLSQSMVRFAGIGNITGMILTTGPTRHLASYNGIVGHQVRKIQEFSYPWFVDALLVLYSDGLTTHWDLNAYPGLLSRHPSLIAGVLYRDFNRGNDDVSVVVVKQKQVEEYQT